MGTLSGREQLAAEKFAEALEVIPLTLGQNAGMDPIDVLTDLRARQSKGSKWTGIDVRGARIADISKLDIVEPVVVKEQIIKSATEAASMILRIDDVIAAQQVGWRSSWWRHASGWHGRHGRHVTTRLPERRPLQRGI